MRRTAASLLLLAATVPLRADEPRAVVERAVQAHGGADNLERCAARRMILQGKSPESAPAAQMSFSGQWINQAPDKLKLRLRIEAGIGEREEFAAVIDGDKGWVQEGAREQVIELNGSQRDIFAGFCQEGYARTLVPLLRDRKFTLTALPDEKVGDRRAVGVKASYPDRPDVALWFDAETHLLVKTVTGSPRSGPGPSTSSMTTLYGDYRRSGEAEERLLAAAGVRTDAAGLSAYLAKQQPDPAALDRARLLVRRLGDESFEVREEASRELLTLGPPALAPLQEAAKDEDLEVSRRAATCAEMIRSRTKPETTRAAVRLLGLRGPDGAAEALLALLPGAEEGIAEEARAALVVLAQRPEGPDAALLRALDDKEPSRRDAARAVLGKDGGAYLNRPGRRLLAPGVRLPYKMTLAEKAGPNLEMVISEYQFVNRFEDREFAKP